METNLVGLELFRELENKKESIEEEIRKKIRYVLISNYLDDTKSKINLKKK
jgi:hypothetical protein